MVTKVLIGRPSVVPSGARAGDRRAEQSLAANVAEQEQRLGRGEADMAAGDLGEPGRARRVDRAGRRCGSARAGRDRSSRVRARSRPASGRTGRRPRPSSRPPSADGMSTRTISPDAGSPAGAARGAEGVANGRSALVASQSRSASSVSGSGARRGLGRRGGAAFAGGLEPVARRLADDRVDAGFLPPIEGARRPARGHHALPPQIRPPLTRRGAGWSIGDGLFICRTVGEKRRQERRRG